MSMAMSSPSSATCTWRLLERLHTHTDTHAHRVTLRIKQVDVIENLMSFFQCEVLIVKVDGATLSQECYGDNFLCIQTKSGDLTKHWQSECQLT